MGHSGISHSLIILFLKSFLKDEYYFVKDDPSLSPAAGVLAESLAPFCTQPTSRPKLKTILFPKAINTEIEIERIQNGETEKVM